MQQSQPFITIGIASYNYANYLREAFDAIRRQSFKDFEVLYADDGSTDDSVAIIRSFIKENPNMNIRLIEGENVGVCGNKQRLIDNARGYYIMLCDADDWMDDDCLSELASSAKTSDADRIVSEIRNIDGSTGQLMYVQSFPENPSKWCELLHHGALYKRSVILENAIRMPDCLPDDYLFITKFNLYAKTTVFVRKSLYNWRLHSGSTSHANWEKNSGRGFSLLLTSLDFLDTLFQTQGDRLTDRDHEDLACFITKNYYYFLIKDIAATAPIKNAYRKYRRLRELVQERVPGYTRIVIKRGLKNSPFRPSLHLEICTLSLLERAHVLFPSLILFGFITGARKKHAL